MPQSRSVMYAHVLFTTRRQTPMLTNMRVREELNAYVTGICLNHGTPSVCTHSMPDHVHLLVRLSRERVLAHVVREVQQGSSNWLQSRHRMLDFDWADEHWAFSISPPDVDAVTRYIQRHDQLHHRTTFQQEVDQFFQRTPRPSCKDQVYVHIIFSTKNRIPFLTNRDVRKNVFSFMEDVYSQWGTTALCIGGYEDHAHVFGTLSVRYPVARMVQELKRASTVRIKTRHGIEEFDWQDGYGAFSVSPKHVEAVVHYIERQEEHHSKFTFADEMEALRRTIGGLPRAVSPGSDRVSFSEGFEKA